jgi:hypothetical protein
MSILLSFEISQVSKDKTKHNASRFLPAKIVESVCLGMPHGNCRRVVCVPLSVRPAWALVQKPRVQNYKLNLKQPNKTPKTFEKKLSGEIF